AELMKIFYQNLLNKKQTPAEALRNAQLDLSSRARWRSPYFWSAFVLQGEWQ
ncbi:MAG: CHAT domain-containing protein, partial [Gammaproteobacteria bacterium]|nr:CHAT domain-containing protein [Gammaproteobacteria bacterium]